MTQIEIYELQIKIMQNTIETQEAIIELLNLEIKEIKKEIEKL
jgi:hypothetical protein